MATNTTETKVLFIKDMLCKTCVRVLRQSFETTGVEIFDIKPGRMVVRYKPDEIGMSEINKIIIENGFELIVSKEEKIISQVKHIILDLVRVKTELLKNKSFKLSDYLSKTVGVNYNYLSKLFSKHENKSIEKYLIQHKIERVKELLEYQEMSLTEIANLMGYSSLQHLSHQFKLVTGLSVVDYKKAMKVMRKYLNEIV